MTSQATRTVRVLIVDDSPLVQELLTKGLSMDPGIEVVGAATDPYAARDQLLQLRPDVLTLDVTMPRMDGVAFLRKLMPQYPIPVIMVSSLTGKGQQVTLDALAAGAVDFVTKPEGNNMRGLSEMIVELQVKIKGAARANVAHWKGHTFAPQTPSPAQAPKPVVTTRYDDALAKAADRVILVGASTGGTEAIKGVVEKLPAMTPGMLIVQHMPSGFTSMFARRLDRVCAMEAKEAEHNDEVRPGRILVAPGGFQMRLAREGGRFVVKVQPGELVCGHCPAVEVLMQSAALTAGEKAVGVMLTGMGRDGAEGMVALRRSGAHCLAQDEETSVVFGMPREAYERGGAEALVPLERMGERIMQTIAGPRR